MRPTRLAHPWSPAMKPSIPVLLLLLAVAGPLAAQQVYTWTDANGVKHFSDEPPPASVKDTKKVIVRGGVTSTEDANKPADEAAGKGPGMAAAAGYSAEDIKRNCATAQRMDTISSSRALKSALCRTRSSAFCCRAGLTRRSYAPLRRRS